MKVSTGLSLLCAIMLSTWVCVEGASAEVLKLKYQFDTTIEEEPNRAPAAETKAGRGDNAESETAEDRSGDAKKSGENESADANATENKSKSGKPKIEYRHELTDITLAVDHFFVENSKKTTLFDFKTKRVTNFDAKSMTYQQHSLFVYCAFKDLEIRNRGMLAEVLEKVGMADTTASVIDQFDVACELGMIMPDKPDNPGITMKDNGDSLVFSYNDKVIAEAVFDDSLDATLFPTAEKFLIYKTSLHPFVRQEILARHKILKSLNYDFRSAFRKYTVKLSLVDKSKLASEADHFAGYKLDFDKETPLYAVQQKVMLDDKPIALPSREAAFAEAQKFVNIRDLTDAFLTVTEYNITTGDRAEEESGDIITDVHDDPNFKLIAQCLEPSSKKEAESALSSLNEIKTDGLKKGYVIEVFKGNIAESLGLDASKMFLKALDGNPHLTGVYNDLGKYYYARFDSLSAWNSWDLARKVCPAYPMLGSVAKLESRLQRLHPEYF